MTTSFPGNERYRVVRKLGEGGMGIVFEAFDRERKEHVALKTLRSFDAESLFRLKREFRGLARIRDPNLITLFDLVAVEETCFFTMELLTGANLVDHIRQVPHQSAQLAHPGAPISELRLRTDENSWTPEKDQRLRSCLPQLVRGICRLHAAGKVHSDIKPHNIVVTPEGRVVLLDFGLFTELDGTTPSSGEFALGTARYMAPEQCRGAQPTPASDWYGVGAVVFECLTGQPAFRGTPSAIMVEKQRRVPPPPRALSDGVPHDLDTLCTRLLMPTPSDRPGGSEILRMLGVSSDRYGSLGAETQPPAEFRIAGREQEMGLLFQALSSVSHSVTAAVLLTGDSGIGKTALLEDFLRLAQTKNDDLVVLKGRCYEHEDVPYQAMDGIVDDLTHYWSTLSHAAASDLVPDEINTMRKVFPVLGRVPAISAISATRPANDPQEIRHQAILGLRRTLRHITERQPLVLALDDMQWAYPSTLDLISDLMHPPNPPGLLIIMASRPEYNAPLLDLIHQIESLAFVQVVDRLDPEAAAGLATQFLGPSREALAATVARESNGMPLFVMEMARHAQTIGTTNLHELQLDELLGRRIEDLDDRSRQVLDTIALATPGIGRQALRLSTGLNHRQLSTSLRSLQDALLIIPVGHSDDRLWEPAHDRIRKAVIARIPVDSRSAIHRRLAKTAGTAVSSDQLAYHWSRAGEKHRAAEHAEAAAADALKRYDFETAARHFRMAIGLGGHTPTHCHELEIALAEALADAGHAAEAAAAFTLAAAGYSGFQAFELRRRAAEELVRSGSPIEGIAALREVLGDVGLHLARTPLRSLVSLLINRALLLLRGLKWHERQLDEIPPNIIKRIDSCWSASAGLGFIDPLRGAEYQAKHLRLALDAGERTRVLRALTVETSYRAVSLSRRVHVVNNLTQQLAGEVDDPYICGIACLADAFVAYYVENRWRKALKILDRAKEFFRIGGGGWELDSTMLWSLFSQIYLGQFSEIAQLVPDHARAAERRGDLFMSVNVCARANMIWLIRDRIDRAQQELEKAVQSWVEPAPHFHLQHFFILCAQCEIELYRGRPDEADVEMSRALPSLSRHHFNHIPLAHLEILCLRTRIALARAERCPDSTRLWLHQAKKLIRQINRIKLPLARGLAPALTAALHALQGNQDDTIDLLRQASTILREHETNLYRYSVDTWLASLLGGTEGEALLEETRTWMSEQGVANGDRLAASILPGFSRRHLDD